MIDKALERYKSFAEDLASNYWEKKPGVFHLPFGKPLIESRELMDLVPALAEEHDEAVLLLSKNQKPLGLRDFCPNMFDDVLDYEDFENMILAALRLKNGHELFCYFSNLQRFYGELWTRFVPILSSLQQRVGMPGNRIELDMFLGCYAHTPSGIHKDSASLGFVTSGRKRILVWPYETFLDVPGVKEADPFSETAFFLGNKVRLEDYRDKAIVLEGGPGDVLYWPSHYWHIGEGAGSVSSMVTLAFFIPDNLSRSFETAFRKVYNENKVRYTTRKIEVGYDEQTLSYTGANEVSNRARDLYRDLESGLEEEFELLAHQISLRASMLGFAEPPLLGPLSFEQSRNYRLTNESALALYRTSSKFEIHASGKVFLVKDHYEDIVELVTNLRKSKVVCWENLEFLGEAHAQMVKSVLTFLLNRRILCPAE